MLRRFSCSPSRLAHSRCYLLMVLWFLQLLLHCIMAIQRKVIKRHNDLKSFQPICESSSPTYIVQLTRDWEDEQKIWADKMKKRERKKNKTKEKKWRVCISFFFILKCSVSLIAVHFLSLSCNYSSIAQANNNNSCNLNERTKTQPEKDQVQVNAYMCT